MTGSKNQNKKQFKIGCKAVKHFFVKNLIGFKEIYIVIMHKVWVKYSFSFPGSPQFLYGRQSEN